VSQLALKETSFFQSRDI